MRANCYYVTGTDTGVGKTVFACLLVRHLRSRGLRVAGLKPIASGGRDDARLLKAASGSVLSLNEVNPWHFPNSLAPVLAARKTGTSLRLPKVMRHVSQVRPRFDALVLEGAGGLLSPMGEGFDSRDLIQALCATPFIVARNELGAVGRVRLVLDALSPCSAAAARVVLMCQERNDSSASSNESLLGEYIDPNRIFQIPWLSRKSSRAGSSEVELLDNLLL